MSGTRLVQSRRGGGRQARKARRQSEQPPRAPYINRKIATFDFLNNEGLSEIEENADLILKDIGMEFRGDPEILSIFKDAGCDVKGERVRFEPGMCRSVITATAPSEVTQHARKPENSIVLGGSNTVLAPGWGPPFIHNMDEGRRYATIGDFRNLVKMHQMMPEYHHSGGVICEPVDLPANTRHLDMIYAHLKYSDRAIFGALIGEERATDSINMARIVFGDRFVAENCCLYAVSNTNAPLVMDAAMSGSLKTYARAGQMVAVTPWTLTGAMSPCTPAGTLAQVLAEALAGMCLAQLIKPGAPVMFGSFASTMSMQSGAPTFGNPEGGLIVLAAGQLARRLGVPFHTVGALSASKLPDAQAMAEGTFGLIMSVLAGANFINHAGGWLEGGLVHGFEKAVLDADLCGKLATFCQGLDLSSESFALDAIAEVGPGAHFLGSSHTQAHFATALFMSKTADNNSFEQWSADGARDATQRANARWKQLLAEYEEPQLDPAIDEALQAYIAHRKEEMPASDYY